MSLLLALFVGLLVGGAGGFILQESYDLLILNLCMGIVGAVLGDAIYFFASGDSLFLFTIAGLLSQICGAMVAVLLFSLVHQAMPKETIDSDELRSNKDL